MSTAKLSRLSEARSKTGDAETKFLENENSLWLYQVYGVATHKILLPVNHMPQENCFINFCTYDLTNLSFIME